MRRNKFAGLTVEVTAHGDKPYYFAVSMAFDGARYHFWTNEERQPRDNILYKNPPKGITSRDPGNFDTRYLRQDSKPGYAMRHYMMFTACTKGLFDEAAKRQDDEEASKEQARLESARVRQLEEHGPKLAELAAAVVKAAYANSECGYGMDEIVALRTALIDAGYYRNVTRVT